MTSPTAPSATGDSSSSSTSNALATTASPSLPPIETTALTTPSAKSHPFVFLSEEKIVPEQLNHLQETSLRRRQEFQTNVHELELAVASATARLAHERMDRDQQLSQIISQYVYKPLEIGRDELQLHTETNSTTRSRWVQLEGRLSALDTNMTHSIHVQNEDSRREKMDELLFIVEQEVVPDAKLECSKADKREGGIFRRLEDLAGSMARRFHEERASLKGQIATVTRQIHAIEDLDSTKGSQLLQRIHHLKSVLEEESEIRSAHDARILQLIANREAVMKEALLETVGNELEWENSVSNFMLPAPSELQDGEEYDGVRR